MRRRHQQSARSQRSAHLQSARSQRRLAPSFKKTFPYGVGENPGGVSSATDAGMFLFYRSSLMIQNVFASSSVSIRAFPCLSNPEYDENTGSVGFSTNVNYETNIFRFPKKTSANLRNWFARSAKIYREKYPTRDRGRLLVMCIRYFSVAKSVSTI